MTFLIVGMTLKSAPTPLSPKVKHIILAVTAHFPFSSFLLVRCAQTSLALGVTSYAELKHPVILVVSNNINFLK